MRRSLILGAFLLLPAAALASPDSVALPISSPTVQNPAQLIRGLAAPASAPSVPFFPERLEYEVKWGIFSVGTADLRVREVQDFNGVPAYHIVSEAKSNGFCDTFYKVRDLNEAWLGTGDLRSLGYSKQLREGGFFRDEWVLYDYKRGGFLSKTTNRDGNYSFSGGTIPVSVQDILSSMYYIRSKPLKVGDEIILDVNTKQNWPLVIKVLRKQKVAVPAGKFDAIIVEPFLRQEGIFIQKGKRLQIWLTDDARKIPVQMSVEVFFGNVTASLTGIR